MGLKQEEKGLSPGHNTARKAEGRLLQGFALLSLGAASSHSLGILCCLI